jgi:hypothetical protein
MIAEPPLLFPIRGTFWRVAARPRIRRDARPSRRPILLRTRQREAASVSDSKAVGGTQPTALPYVPIAPLSWAGVVGCQTESEGLKSSPRPHPLRAAKGRPARREKISVRVTARLRMPEEVSPQRDNAVTKPLESFAASYPQNSLRQSCLDAKCCWFLLRSRTAQPIPVVFRTPRLFCQK